MKATRSSSNSDAFTVLELLCVIGIIVVLAALVLPAVSQAKSRAKRIQCVEQLHQTGLAFLTFAHEHDGKFPMSVGTNAGGSLEYLQSAYQNGQGLDLSFRHFQALADELRTPKVVNCPADSRVPAASFPMLKNENVSYFVGINAEFSHPNSILSGDRNLTNDFATPSAIIRVGPNATLRWTRELHEYKGNLLFADGRVEENNSPRLALASGQAFNANLALPTSPPSTRPGASSPNGPPTAPGLQPSPIPGGNPAWPKVQPVANQGTAASTQPTESSFPAKNEPWMPRPTAVSQTRSPDNAPPPGAQSQNISVPAAQPAVSATNPSAWLLRTEKPADPGFSLFPQSIAVVPKALVRKSAWPLWILLLLFIGALLARFKFLRNDRNQ